MCKTQKDKGKQQKGKGEKKEPQMISGDALVMTPQSDEEEVYVSSGVLIG